MDPAKQQILGYFIEEAKEHLDTIEKGLLDLQAVMGDPERVNELFRAAHSVKGGAAMLGFGSIQKTSHRLEDSFKILKEYPVSVDQRLESLFLKSFDTLRELIERLQDPYGLREEEADQLVQAAEPNFEELQTYLNTLTGGVAPTGGEGVLPPSDFAPQVVEVLREMLRLFQQTPSDAVRQALAGQCDRLLEIGQAVPAWQAVVQSAQTAIGNPRHSFRTLAPVIIKELKQSCDIIAVGRSQEVMPSPSLQQLASMNGHGVPVLVVKREPKAAAEALKQAFSKAQLAELVTHLKQAL